MVEKRGGPRGQVLRLGGEVGQCPSQSPRVACRLASPALGHGPEREAGL